MKIENRRHDEQHSNDDLLGFVSCSPASERRALGRKQFGLATLFGITAVLAVALAAWKHWSDGAAAYESLRHSGAKVIFGASGQFVVVDLSGKDIDEAQLRVLSRIPDRMDLDLSQTNVTNDAIEHLIRAPTLARVDLTGTKVDAEGIRRLNEARPDVAIAKVRFNEHITW